LAIPYLIQHRANVLRFAAPLGLLRELTVVLEGAVIWERALEAVQPREPAYLFLAMSDKRFGQLGSSSSWRGESPDLSMFKS